jgi:hypothetical protein
MRLNLISFAWNDEKIQAKRGIPDRHLASTLLILHPVEFIHGFLGAKPQEAEIELEI